MYLAFIYYKERRRYHFLNKITLYDILLAEGILCLLLDGITAYTVNHQEIISSAVNLILHGLFLLSIDALLFLLLLYTLDATKGIPDEWWKRVLVAVPFVINVIIVLWNLPTLEYRHGEAGYYSMGISVYTCYAMSALYILLIFVHVFRRWNSIESHKKNKSHYVSSGSNRGDRISDDSTGFIDFQHRYNDASGWCIRKSGKSGHERTDQISR